MTVAKGFRSWRSRDRACEPGQLAGTFAASYTTTFNSGASRGTITWNSPLPYINAKRADAHHRRKRHRHVDGGAGALHRRRAQTHGPFVAINRNAIPENLLESEASATRKARSQVPTRSAKGTSEIHDGRGNRTLG